MAAITEVAPGVVIGAAGAYPPSTAPVDERSVSARIPAWRRDEALAARGLLREILCSVEPRAATAPVIKNERGRPSLVAWPDLGISLAHDRGWVAAAVSTGRCVGVDVQSPEQPVRAGLLDRCVREGRATMAVMSETGVAAELARIWAVQEACVKAAGTGLAGRPWGIDVPVGVWRGRWGSLTWSSVLETTSVPVACAWGEPGSA